MTDINHVTEVGRLTKDLATDEKAFGYLPNGTAKANFSIAVNRSKKQGDEWIDEVNYFDVTLFGKSAENLKSKLTKGTMVVVDGSLRQDRWEKDGQKFSKVYIVADTVQIAGGKKEGGSTQSSAPQTSAPQADFDAAEGFPEDIPF
jgi:single-strand DNA-binding protein